MHIYLTEKGREAFKQLDQASEEQLEQLLGGLSAAEGEDLSRHLTAVMDIFIKAQDGVGRPSAGHGVVDSAGRGVVDSAGQGVVDSSGQGAVTVRTDLRPGDLGYVIHLHGRLYKEEQNFGVGFEAYVAQGLAELYRQYDPEKDRVWVCEQGNAIVGFLALMHRDEQTAQLRYFLLQPECRGVGLGKRLMEDFMGYLREKGYRHCYLWTTSEQQTAIALYKRYGFVFVDEKGSSTFGKQLVEQKYELNL